MADEGVTWRDYGLATPSDRCARACLHWYCWY